MAEFEIFGGLEEEQDVRNETQSKLNELQEKMNAQRRFPQEKVNQIHRQGVAIVVSDQARTPELQKFLDSIGMDRIDVFGPRNDMILCGLNRQLTEAEIQLVRSNRLIRFVETPSPIYGSNEVSFRNSTLENFNTASHIVVTIPFEPHLIRYRRLAVERLLASMGFVQENATSLRFRRTRQLSQENFQNLRRYNLSISSAIPDSR